MEEYRIFVSYSREDLEIVRPLVQLLRVVEDSVFRDVDNIPPGSRWQAVLTSAIDGCETVLLFWCNHSSNSYYVEKEYTQALEFDKKIIPVLLDDTPLPSVLREYQWIDLRQALGGHKEGYVEVVEYIPGILAGNEETEIVRRWQLLIPDEWILRDGSIYLWESLGKILRTQQKNT